MSETQQLNYMIVDGVLGDLVQEIASYIDKLSPPTDPESSFETFTTGLMESSSEEDQEKTFVAIAEKSVVLSNAPEKEFESAYNLVLHILTFSPNLTRVLPVLLENLSLKSTNVDPLQILSILTNLFNILPINSPLRYNVFDTILSFADKTNNIHLLINQFKQLPQWLNDWGCDDSTKKNFYYKISEVLSSSSTSESYKYLVKAVSTIESSDDKESSILSQKLVVDSLLSDFVYDFDEILGLEAVQKLSQTNSELFKLLEIVSNGDYNSFKSFNRINDLTTEQWELLEKKVKVLALGAIVYKVSQTSRTISYREIGEYIDIKDDDDVEIWVIDTIRAGLVEGRLSQNEKEFDIHRATPIGQFGIEQWTSILGRLESWRSSLKDVVEVIRNARENAQRENVGKFRHNISV